MPRRLPPPPPPLIQPRISFLALDPEVRNTIYERVYAHHKRLNSSITISSEQGPREVPNALSRTCRQIRLETLPYFFHLGHIIFVVRTFDDLRACREWIAFVPEQAWTLIKCVRVRHAHTLARVKERNGGNQCNVHFEVKLDDPAMPVTVWGHRRERCPACGAARKGEDFTEIVKGVMTSMYMQNSINRVSVDLTLDMLQPLLTE